MEAMIFGIRGQDGFYWNNLLVTNSIDMVGVSRSIPKFIIGDVSNYEIVEQLIKDNRSEYIFHLAANSSTGHHALFENYQTIVTGTLNILECVYKH
jgi:GDPmannose 4,6-dehydratase